MFEFLLRRNRKKISKLNLKYVQQFYCIDEIFFHPIANEFLDRIISIFGRKYFPMNLLSINKFMLNPLRCVLLTRSQYKIHNFKSNSFCSLNDGFCILNALTKRNIIDSWHKFIYLFIGKYSSELNKLSRMFAKTYIVSANCDS